MKRFLLASATLLALTVAQPTLAADAPVYKGPAPVAALFNWTGFYIGLQAGYGWGTSNHRQGPAQSNDFNIDGFVGGGTLGYNWQTGGLVFGLETDISWSNIKGQGPSSAGFGCGPVGCETSVKWFGTLRGRLGAAWDRSLLYVTGGLAYGELHAQLIGSALFNGGETKAGWTIGAGWEWAFAPNWSTKIEYLNVNFDRFVHAPAATPPATALARFHVIRGGVNWRF